MQPSLFDLPPEAPAVDQAARDFAVDPSHHVVLEASAGTGKTRVLVDRYVRLIESGVDPRHILAMTFTRKAAAEMRDRVLAELERRAARNAAFRATWKDLSDRISDIQVSTIDAFCFGLLREFPLEADVDPAFEIADETEIARFANETLDLTWRAARGDVVSDENVRLLFARVRLGPLRDAVGGCLDRRHVALPAIRTFIARHVRFESSTGASRAFIARLRDLLERFRDRQALLDDGPAGAPEFGWLHADLRALETFPSHDANRVRQLEHRLTRYFLTEAKKPRAKAAGRFERAHFPSADAKRRHDAAIKSLGPDILGELEAFQADVNGLLARGLLRIVERATKIYERLLEEHALLDFAAMLARTVALLRQREEFARSRLKLQARYHHVLVDEFQDTSRLQWELVEHLIDAWREGDGATDGPTSIFVVGDRKQSIYRFRNAEVTLLDAAARKIAALRPGVDPRRSIAQSFRAVPELLAFVNALADHMPGDPDLPERFRYEEADRFPMVAPGDGLRDGEPVVGLVAEPTMEQSARSVASEIARLLESAVVRARVGPPRPAQPSDIAILFRARAGHQYFEDALEAQGIRSYVYKGLGFFDAPEVQDLQALIRYMAQPESDLRAAEFLRSRFVRVSDRALSRLAPGFARVLSDPEWTPPGALADLDADLLSRARDAMNRWLPLADHLPPSQLIDLAIRESGYLFEMRGRRLDQARENVKKARSLVRRVESRGYATVGRLAAYFETLRAGDESNAIVAASGAVNLMTIHAAKGLEFPIVFIVNVHAGGPGVPPVSVIERGPGDEPHVAFSSTPGTKLEERRDREELRRLLYVAATRARDRLYFAGVTDRHGALVRSARSLAGLLPQSLLDCFSTVASAAEAATPVRWLASRGAETIEFSLRACRGSGGPAPRPAAAAPSIPSDLDLLVSATPSILYPSSQNGQIAARPVADQGSATDGDALVTNRLVGTLVHRLLQRNLPSGIEAQAVAALVPQLVSWEERVDIENLDQMAHQVAAHFQRLRSLPEVTTIIASGEVRYEVPFSYQVPERPGQILRGAIDCLILHGEDAATILEFKTGRPRPEHDEQARVYREAVKAIFPARNVDVRVIYA